MKVETGFAVIRKWGNAIRQEGFVKKVLVLAGGTTFAQGILVLFSPILTRLYSPEDFGVLAVYVSIVAILAVIASLRYEIAIPLPEKEEAAVNLTVLSLLIVIGMSLTIGVGMWLFGAPIVTFLQAPSLTRYLWLLPVSLFGIGVYQVLNYWALRRKNYAAIARTKINQSIGQLVIQLGLGWLSFGKSGLLLGDVAGRIGGSGSLFSLLWKEGKTHLQAVNLSSIRHYAYMYRKFPLISSWSALFNGIGFQIVPLLITMLYGVHVAGWFMLSQRVIGAPLGLIGNAVSQVYTGEGARLARENPAELNRLFYRTVIQLLKVGLIPFAVVTALGPWLFEWIFGAIWREAGSYVQVMGIMYLVQFIVVPLSHTLNILERQNWQLYWDIGRLGLMGGGLLLAQYFGLPAWYAICIYSVLMTVAYVLLLLLSGAAIRQSMRVKVNQ